ncbi:MAG: DUF1573 domain-containing protein [Spirochaetes bacterium]|nr:DUF1573 domain-containing protein [Spirochaetota bacterium]
MQHGAIPILHFTVLITLIIPQPRIVFETENYNFGIIKPHAVYTAKILFWNRGTALLKIKKIESYCGCVSSFVKTNEIKPGGDGVLEIHFNSEDYSNEVIKYIYIYTNDPKNEVVEITIKAVVIN